MAAARSTSRRQRRRDLRRATRRRVRGGENRAPVAVQRIARQVDDVAWVAGGRARRLLCGDRPFVLGFLALLVVGVIVISGPLSSYLDQRGRVTQLEHELAVLDEANRALERRAEDLRDPRQQELIAREDYGYIRPGEVPYVVVPPEPDAATFPDPRAAEEAPVDLPWYRDAWNAVTTLFG